MVKPKPLVDLVTVDVVVIPTGVVLIPRGFGFENEPMEPSPVIRCISIVQVLAYEDHFVGEVMRRTEPMLRSPPSCPEEAGRLEGDYGDS